MINQANLKGAHYSLLVTLFYVGYLVAEYPSNYLMQKFPTGKYLTVNFILWGKRHIYTASPIEDFALTSGSRCCSRLFRRGHQLHRTGHRSILPRSVRGSP